MVWSAIQCALTSITAVLMSIIVFLWLYTRRTHSYWKKKGIPFDTPSPIVGTLGGMMRESFGQYLLRMWRTLPGDYFGGYLAHQPVLIVQNPELAKKILVKNFDCFKERYTASPKEDIMAQLNMFSGKTALVSKVRKECTPMFTTVRLRLLTEYMNLNARALVTRIHEELDKGHRLNVKDLAVMYASDTLSFTVFGHRISSLSGKYNPILDIARIITNWNFLRSLEFYLCWLIPPVARLFNFRLFSAEAGKLAKGVFWSVVEERKKTDYTADKDLVGLLLKMRDNIDLPEYITSSMRDDLLTAQTVLFALGSTDSTATNLCFMLHELAHAPDKQDKLYQEVMTVWNKSGKEELDYDDLKKLKYLTCCIQETLRKFPPVPHMDRVCNTAYRVDDQLTIEPGTPVFISVMALHYNENLFENPNAWMPERFATNDSEEENRKLGWLPFGDGPRNCIGQRYGMMQIRAAVAHMVRDFRFEPAAPYNIKVNPYSIVCTPMDARHVKFVLRETRCPVTLIVKMELPSGVLPKLRHPTTLADCFTKMEMQVYTAVLCFITIGCTVFYL